LSAKKPTKPVDSFNLVDAVKAKLARVDWAPRSFAILVNLYGRDAAVDVLCVRREPLPVTASITWLRLGVGGCAATATAQKFGAK
jgi:hypothetical protein